MPEVEVFGVDYERYALSRLLQGFAGKYNIKTVLEVPAHGAKAMPSLYSLGFGLSGCKVTLINGDERKRTIWNYLGIDGNVTFDKCADIENMNFADNSFDFVWNFAFIPTYPNPKALLAEMTRVSKKYVAVFSVNGLNVGFPIHRAVHRMMKIPWTHGDVRFNYPGEGKRFFKESGLNHVKVGVVDCPVWPDSLGFRDVRLHRSNKDMTQIEWDSKLIKQIKTNTIPKWIKAVYAWERVPVPLFIKYLYSHIFFVLGEK
ncbi:MAG: methyltransferase domain-containing protein [Sedimentisphaerales bacterium]|nr:methyltransferase domain-containing protein [Sedimentisphaerales bacterium]